MASKFSLGRVVWTPGAMDAIAKAWACADDASAVDLAQEYLKRHEQGDWGEVSAEDARENEESLAEGYRLMSVYTLDTGEAIWIITEADRSVTTILLPDEY